MAARDLAEEVAEIRGYREIASFVEMRAVETRPPAEDTTPSDWPAEDQHGGRATVIGAAIAVLGDRSTELRHGENDHVGHAITQIAVERDERVAKFLEPRR
jgi:hypothetical protein